MGKEKVERDFAGKTICLSGEFNYGSKKQVEELLSEKGALLTKSVSGKLDVLILGKNSCCKRKRCYTLVCPKVNIVGVMKVCIKL